MPVFETTRYLKKNINPMLNLKLESIYRERSHLFLGHCTKYCFEPILKVKLSTGTGVHINPMLHLKLANIAKILHLVLALDASLDYLFLNFFDCILDIFGLQHKLFYGLRASVFTFCHFPHAYQIY